MMKVRMTLLVGAGAVSGLVMSAALPAGATTGGGLGGGTTGGGVLGGGGGTGAPPQPVPGACPTANGVPYTFTGQVANGPDAGQMTLTGTLCIDPTRPNADDRAARNHGDDDDNEGPPTRVTGSIRVDQSPANRAPATGLAVASVIQVRGAVVGQNITFHGRERIATAVPAARATAAGNAAIARQPALFIRARGVQLSQLQKAAAVRAVPYGGTFEGVRRGDFGGWTASVVTDGAPANARSRSGSQLA